MNFYNEFDPKAAAWLRQLIKDGAIPDGVVDERSITEITPNDISGFTQAHFFAGIGGWSQALKLAGWPTDRPVWTASLPCQPFSSAGQQKGTDDDRHLWPVFERLVRECRPPAIFGEQVASKIAREQWFPGVCLDLEALGYSVAGADLCAPLAGEIGEGRIVRGDQETWERIIIGAPHIRQRLYWVAHLPELRWGERNPHTAGSGERAETEGEARRPAERGNDGGLAHSEGTTRNRAILRDHARAHGRITGGVAHPHRLGELRDGGSGNEGTRPCGEPLGRGMQQTGGDGAHHGLANPRHDGAGGIVGTPGDEGGRAVDAGAKGLRQAHRTGGAGGADARGSGGGGVADPTSQRRRGGTAGVEDAADVGTPSEAHRPKWSGFWTDSTPIPCRDGKARRIPESGIFPLVNGLPRGVVPSGDPGAPDYANATAEARAMRLKGYGNAIIPPLAAEFISIYMEVADA